MSDEIIIEISKMLLKEKTIKIDSLLEKLQLSQEELEDLLLELRERYLQIGLSLLITNTAEGDYVVVFIDNYQPSLTTLEMGLLIAFYSLAGQKNNVVDEEIVDYIFKEQMNTLRNLVTKKLLMTNTTGEYWLSPTAIAILANCQDEIEATIESLQLN